MEFWNLSLSLTLSFSCTHAHACACVHTHTHTHTHSLSLSLFQGYYQIVLTVTVNLKFCTRLKSLFCVRVLPVTFIWLPFGMDKNYEANLVNTQIYLHKKVRIFFVLCHIHFLFNVNKNILYVMYLDKYNDPCNMYLSKHNVFQNKTPIHPSIIRTSKDLENYLWMKKINVLLHIQINYIY